MDSLRYGAIDIEMLLHRDLPVGKARQLPHRSLLQDFFDRVDIRPEAVLLARGTMRACWGMMGSSNAHSTTAPLKRLRRPSRRPSELQNCLAILAENGRYAGWR